MNLIRKRARVFRYYFTVFSVLIVVAVSACQSQDKNRPRAGINPMTRAYISDVLDNCAPEAEIDTDLDKAGEYFYDPSTDAAVEQLIIACGAKPVEYMPFAGKHGYDRYTFDAVQEAYENCTDSQQPLPRAFPVDRLINDPEAERFFRDLASYCK